MSGSRPARGRGSAHAARTMILFAATCALAGSGISCARAAPPPADLNYSADSPLVAGEAQSFWRQLKGVWIGKNSHTWRIRRTTFHVADMHCGVQALRAAGPDAVEVLAHCNVEGYDDRKEDRFKFSLSDNGTLTGRVLGPSDGSEAFDLKRCDCSERVTPTLAWGETIGLWASPDQCGDPTKEWRIEPERIAAPAMSCSIENLMQIHEGMHAVASCAGTAAIDGLQVLQFDRTADGALSVSDQTRGEKIADLQLCEGKQ